MKTVIGKMMDVVVQTSFVCVLWLIFTTVLSPVTILLMLSQAFRQKWFAFVYLKIVRTFFLHAVEPLREKWFRLLSEDLIGKDDSIPLDVLEIGIGGGENLKYYPKNTRLVALDANPEVAPTLNESRKKYPHVNIEKLIIAKAEDMKEIKDGSMDVVVCTYVLCSVGDVKKAIQEVKRVLKSEGKFLFLEHVAYPKNSVGYFLQKVVTPLWKLNIGNCCFKASTEDVLKRGGFSNIYMTKAEASKVIFLIRPQLAGIATK